MSKVDLVTTSPTLPYVHLYSFTSLLPYLHLSLLFLQTGVFVMAVITIPHPLSISFSLALSLSPSLSSLTHTRTCTRLNACTCIYQNGWRVTRCLPVIRMNHRVAEKASGGLGLRISAYSLRSLRRPKSVGVLYNTRACRAQANRRAYSSRENARRLFRHRSPP